MGVEVTEPGTLYVVATPIGNLGDLSMRAREVLAGVAAIAAEDTRHTRQLLAAHGIATPLLALHEHNEASQAPALVARLARGESLALVSDAGTPLMSDPGFLLVRAARAAGLRVSPIPGACAAVAALSVAGLPAERFVFEGFLPAKPAARRARLAHLAAEPRTLVIYEAPHRLADTLADLLAACGAERPAVLARELTKLHERVIGDSLGELVRWAAADPHAAQGEVVLLVGGAAAVEQGADEELDRVLGVLLAELPVRQAAALAASLTGATRNAAYARALHLKGEAAGAE